MLTTINQRSGVCLIIVTYNRLDTLLKTLNHIGKLALKPDEVVVVNNASIDHTKDRLNAFNEFRIHTIHLASNLGFGYGLSQGMKFTLSHFIDIDYFLLMDDDSQPDMDLIRNLLEARKVIDKPGIICSMGYVDDLWKGPLSIYGMKNKLKRRISNDLPIYNVDHVLVDGALIDRTVVDHIGTLREDVFMMCEDREYCARIMKAGFAISVLEDEHMMNRLHLGGGDRFSFNTRWRGYYHARNHLMIVKEYFTFRLLLMYIIRQTKYLMAATLAPDRVDRIRLRLLGIFHGLIGKMGKTIDPQSYPRK